MTHLRRLKIARFVPGKENTWNSREIRQRGRLAPPVSLTLKNSIINTGTAMKCPKCDHENPEAQTFCSACGEKLDEPPTEAAPAGWYCIKCGFRSENTAKFCGSCGSAHPTSAPATPPDEITPRKDTPVSIASFVSALLGAPLFWFSAFDTFPEPFFEIAMTAVFALHPLALALGIWGLCQRASLKRFAILGVIFSSVSMLAILVIILNEL